MKNKKKQRKIIPIWVVVSGLSVAVLLLLSFLARRSALLSDAVNSYVATPIRVINSYLTYLIPFSLFEVAFILVFPFALAVIASAFISKRSVREKLDRLVAGVGAVAIFFSGYLAVMTIPYNTTPLSARLGISEKEDISADELYAVTLSVRDRINELSTQIEYKDGEGVMPYGSDEASRLICEAYGRVRDDYPFFYNFTSRAKPITFSGIMSDMGITGIYTYFTGEANVNTSYPDYCYAFTVAHEFAHQRGINRENEANFMAFLVLSYSDDPFLEYSAYLNLYEYLVSPLYRLDKELYYEIRDGLEPAAAEDISAANRVTVEHMNSPLFQLMNDVNDAYLKSNGTEGVVSYGYVVRLAVAYLLK